MKTRYLLTSFALGLGLALALCWMLGGGLGAARAASVARYVAPGGDDGLDCTDPVNPCATLQHAVDESTDSDVIKVAAGHYDDLHVLNHDSETITQVVFITRSITIQGGYALGDWSTPNPGDNHTVLDGGGQGRVIYIGASVSVTLDGLYIVNGFATGDRNSLAGNGGGVYVENWGTGSLVLRNSQVTSNTANRGGGLNAREVAVTLTGNLFQNNTASLEGGGVRLYECSAYVAHNIFEANTVITGDAGGMQVGWGDVTIFDNDFVNNTANDHAGSRAGGLYASTGAGHAHTVTHNLFRGNRASVEGNGFGGGAYLSSGEAGRMTFSHNQVLDNVATEGTVSWHEGEGGGLWMYAPDDAEALVSDNLFQNNWAAVSSRCTGVGGGMLLKGRIRLERNLFLDNRASRYPDWGGYFPVLGGGVYVAAYHTVTMTNNIFVGNKYFDEDDSPFDPDEDSDGGAIYVGGQTTPTDTRLILLHNTIVDNQSPAICNEAAALMMSHNIFSGHSIDLHMIPDSSWVESSRPPSTTAEYTLWWPEMNVEIISGTFSHEHDFAGDPDLTDDHHLSEDSAAIDRGPGAGVSVDFDGQPRPAGAGYDLGADEYADVDLSQSYKSASPKEAVAGNVLTFTLVLRNDGSIDAANAALSDVIPWATSYVSGSAQATSGALTMTSGVTGTLIFEEISWAGTVPSGEAVTVTFQVTLTQGIPVMNTAILTDGYGASLRLTAWVNARRVYLPVVLRNAGT